MSLSETATARWSAAPEGGLLLEKTAATDAAAGVLRAEAALIACLPTPSFPTILYQDERPGAFSVGYWIRCTQRLDDWLALGIQLPPRAALSLCRGLARCVEALHGQGQPDKQLTPRRFFVCDDPGQGDACLAELGRPSRPAVEMIESGAIAWLSGDVAYLAPEQTGRMNRVIDYRSDLYTLGVIFYRILTGRLPFTGVDELAVVHAHLSLAPPAATAINPELPASYERMLFKLLEKHAEDRYQTAAGLCLDLDYLLARSLLHLPDTGFMPGVRDHSDELQIPQKLYGREADVHRLLDAFQAVAAGDRQVLLVAGSSGSGKSSLINEVHRPITAARGTFVAGKFEQYQRDVPYLGVLAAMRELVDFVLAERADVIEQWRVRIARAVRGEGAALTELMPGLARLLGQGPAPTIGSAEAAAARLRRVLKHFIGAFARPEHPLVICLDDLQWADASSLQLIEDLVADDQTTHLLIIGAYRDNEITPGHLLPAAMDRIALRGVVPVVLKLGLLDVVRVRQLLSDTLNLPAEPCASLAAALYAKTAGNPFHLKVLMASLHQRGILSRSRDHRAWTWDAQVLANEDLAANVVELVLASLRELPPHAAATLSIAAFLGAILTVEDLAVASGRTESEVDDDLIILAQRHFLLRRRGGRGAELRFQHDRIQEAAYKLCPEAERPLRHQQIGQLLAGRHDDLANSPDLFMVLRHLNAGPPLPAGAWRREVQRLNFAGGQRARRTLAYGTAVALLGLVVDALDDAAWRADRAFALDATLEFGQALLLHGEAAHAESLVDALAQRVSDPLEFGRLTLLRCEIYALDGRYHPCIAASRQALVALGVELPSGDFAQWHTQYRRDMQARYGVMPPADLTHYPRIVDPAKALALDLLSRSVPTAYILDASLLCALSAVGVQLSLEHGIGRHSPYFFASYGVSLTASLTDNAEAVRYAEAGLQMAEHLGDKANICMTLQAQLFVSHWVHPLGESTSLARRAVEAGIQSGETRFIGYAHHHHSHMQFAQGVPLPRLMVTVTEYRQLASEGGSRHRRAVDSLEGVQTLIRLLSADPAAPTPDAEAALIAEWRARGGGSANLLYKVERAQIHMLLREWEPAARLLEEVRVDDLRTGAPGAFGNAVQLFYETMALARRAATGAIDQAGAVARIVANRTVMVEWARTAPSNFTHYPQAADAELAALQGDLPLAIAHLRAAVQSAQAAEFRLDHILLAERAAQWCFSVDLSVEACTFLTAALRTARILGATAKVHDLLARYPILAAPAEAPVDGRVTLGTLELTRVLELMAAFHAEASFSALIERVAQAFLELTSATGFALLMRGEDGPWQLRAHQDLARSRELQLCELPFERAPAAAGVATEHAVDGLIPRAPTVGG